MCTLFDKAHDKAYYARIIQRVIKTLTVLQVQASGAFKNHLTSSDLSKQKTLSVRGETVLIRR